jgi:hypothetical protein
MFDIKDKDVLETENAQIFRRTQNSHICLSFEKEMIRKSLDDRAIMHSENDTHSAVLEKSTKTCSVSHRSQISYSNHIFYLDLH